MPNRLRERKFGCREDRDSFYHAIKLSHRDVIRGTEQEEGLVSWFVMYGDEKKEAAVPTGLAKVLNEIYNPPDVITVEADGSSEPVAALPAEGFVPLEAIGGLKEGTGDNSNGLIKTSTPETMLGEAPLPDSTTR